MPKTRAARAWILTGGWPGHDPEGVAAWTAQRLAGLGLAGTHGGKGDAFRNSLAYQWLVGGQFVGHPGDVRSHRVSFDPGSPLLGDLAPITLVSERYVMLVDPAVSVHARSSFDAEPLPWFDGVQVPVAWTRRWGRGRVANMSIGHTVDDLRHPTVATGFDRLAGWAAGVSP